MISIFQKPSTRVRVETLLPSSPSSQRDATSTMSLSLTFARATPLARPRVASRTSCARTRPCAPPRRATEPLARPRATPASTEEDESRKMTSKTVDALDVSSSTASTATRTYEWDALDVFLSYSALALALALGDGRALSGWQFGYVPYFAALASLSIYIGAHRGLTRDFRETISFESSLAGPFVLSGALFAAYVCLEVFKLDLSVVTNAYFFILSAFAVAGNAVEPLHASGEWWRESAVKIAVPNGWATDPKTGEVVEDAELDVTPAQMVGAVAGLALATADLQAGHQSFTLNNAVACFIVSDFLSVIGFGSFKSCATALVGLLAYDAFWVFKSESVVGQNVMMSVATNQSFNGPFRLLFPRFEDVLNPLPIDTFPFSLLGLGDIAIPGMLCALMLRYDASRATDLRGRANAAASAFMDVFDTEREEVAKNVSNGSVDADDVDVEIDGYRTGIGRRAGDAAVLAYDEANGVYEDAISIPSSLGGRAFFATSIQAYLIGLLAAVSANVVTREGQPALVYLVPITLAAVLNTARTRDELGRFFSFTDERESSI